MADVISGAPGHRPRRWHRARAAAIGLATTGLLVLQSAGSAHADVELQQASPAAGATLRSAPGAVSLQFDELITPLGARVSVLGPAGPVQVGLPVVRGTQVTQALRAPLPAGRYVVRWQVQAIGSDEDGSWSFRVLTAAAAPAPTRSPTATAAATRPSPTTTLATPSVTSATPTTARVSATAATSTPLVTLGSAPGSPTPTTAHSDVPAPQVQPIGYTGSEVIPPPVAIWMAILATLGAGYVVQRGRRRGAAQARRTGRARRRA